MTKKETKNLHHNKERNYVTTKISIETRDRIKKFGKFNDTWDDLINKMADICESSE